MLHNSRTMLAAALLMGLAGGNMRIGGPADGNRIHTERARKGSPEEAERIAAANAKRARKLARRAAQ